MAELLRRVSSAELTEWIALYALRAEEEEQARREGERQPSGDEPARPAGGMGAPDVARIIEEAHERERARDGS